MKKPILLLVAACMLFIASPVLATAQNSYANDGNAAHTKSVYQWEASATMPALIGVFDVYDAGDGSIGERM